MYGSCPTLTRIRLMPARVTCWQSYSSRRSRPRQCSRCSRATSVMRRQLSNSSTCSLSWPQELLLRCRIPSSVMSSQWDRLCSRERATRLQDPHSNAYGLGKAGEQPLIYRAKPKAWALGRGTAAAGERFLSLS